MQMTVVEMILINKQMPKYERMQRKKIKLTASATQNNCEIPSI